MGRPLVEDEGFQAYVKAIQRFEPLDRETELALARRWQTRGDHRAAHRLVCANLRFVVKMAQSYRGYGLRVADLVEEGNIGLLEAVRRFDPARNLRFITYASYWVRAFILAHVLKQWSMVGVGTGPLQSKLFFRMARERARIQSALGGALSEGSMEAQLAKRFGTTPERVRDMTERLSHKDQSLNVAAFRDGEATGLDLLADERTERQEERVARMQRDAAVRTRVESFVLTLCARDRYILHQRLLAEDGVTLAEVGRKLGLSRERVRQLEARLKQKLKRALADLDPARQSLVA